MSFDLNTPISALGGVGAVRRAAFARLGIGDLRSLVYHFPKAYQHRGEIRTVREAADGEVASLLLKIGTQPRTSYIPGGQRRSATRFMAFDDSGRISIIFFNQTYLARTFEVGDEYRFYGRISVRNGVKSIASPAFEPYCEGRPLPPYVPIYASSEGLSQKFIAACVSGAIEGLVAERVEAPLPEYLRQKFGLPDFYTSLRGIHFPLSEDQIIQARRYFITEELFMFALGVCQARLGAEDGSAPAVAVPAAAVGLDRFYAALPFEPTGAQRRAINDIFADMTGGARMTRLISGDVGSGKTVCAAAAAYIAHCGGCQTALMAPTEILAVQHYDDLSPLFASLGMKTELLTGSLRASEKKRVCAALSDGGADVCIGTHALLSEGVKFQNLGLAITDEQHRFGVRQRAALASQDEAEPHVLVMSATPIPRTLALMLYGDLSSSALDELPPGRQKVDTFVVGEQYRERLNGFIRKQTEEGHQAFIVCPAVDNPASELSKDDVVGDIVTEYQIGAQRTLFDDAGTPLHNAVEYAEELKKALPGVEIGLVYGKMRGADKDKVMRDFAEGKISVLVATTVVEVGVNVPNATLMVIENAERFGLSQLHQLRGRVGRGKAKSFCVLVSDAKSENARKRLNIMRESNDGFRIAQTDLEIRGPGDFFPTGSGAARQHGAAGLQLANLCTDMDTLKAAFDAAKEVISLDPSLSLPCNAGLKAAASEMFSQAASSMN